MDLQTLFRIFWRRRFILITAPVLATCCALVIRIFGEWNYKSTAQIASGITVSNELLDKEKYFNPYEIQAAFNNLVEMIKSRSVIGLLSYKLVQHDMFDKEMPFRHPAESEVQKKIRGDINAFKPDFKNELRSKVESLTLLDPKNPQQRALQKVIDAYEYDYESLLKGLNVSRLNNSDFIEISFISENPELSAFVVNTLSSEFIRYYTAIKLIRSNASMESLISIVEQRKAYLDAKQEDLKAFNANNEIVNSDVEGESKIHEKKEYEKEIADEEKRIRGFKLSLVNLDSRIANLENGTKGEEQQPNEKVVSILQQIKSLNHRYTTTGQTDTKLRDSIALLRAQLQTVFSGDAVIENSGANKELKELKQKREETAVSLDIARDNLRSLNNILQSMRYSIGNFANKEAISNALAKEVEVARAEYLAAQEHFSAAKEKLITNKMMINQVLYGEVPEKPESGKTIILLVFTGVLSFALCAFVIVLIHLSDARIQTVARLKDLTKLQVAGSIKSFSPKIGELGWKFFMEPNGHQQELNQLNHDLRKIRFEIESRNAQVLLITSTQQGQGKSFLIMALAHAFALIHKRTLIIDTNMRNNSLTKMLIARISLLHSMKTFQSTKLLGMGESDDKEVPPPKSAESSLITQTANKRVDIIGNKTSAFSPLELIPTGDFVTLLKYLRNQYDYIILEGSALNEFSDSQELERFVDLVIPVFSADLSLSETDYESIDHLVALKERLGPSILNKFNPDVKQK